MTVNSIRTFFARFCQPVFAGDKTRECVEVLFLQNGQVRIPRFETGEIALHKTDPVGGAQAAEDRRRRFARFYFRQQTFERNQLVAQLQRFPLFGPDGGGKTQMIHIGPGIQDVLGGVRRAAEDGAHQQVVEQRLGKMTALYPVTVWFKRRSAF